MRIGKTFTFDAAHYLPDYDGPCGCLHGHTYHLTVEVEGPIQSDGMVIDFKDVSEIVKALLRKDYDHAYLNDFVENPTAENLAVRIFKELDYQFDIEDISDAQVSSVILHETPTSYVIVTREDVV